MKINLSTRYILGIATLPILLKIHLIFEIFQASPVYFFSGLGIGPHLAPAPPYASIDFNVGATSQTLGHLAALDLLQGVIPWWNPFEGAGTPLAGEMQSAALLPSTVLLALPDGQLYMQLLFQIIAGVFTYLLLCRMGISAFAAFIAAVLFEFNGAYGWMANAVINPIAFLPMILFGVEGCFAANHGSGRWIAAGIALSLYAGFPEVAYIDGLLVVLWTLTRAGSFPPAELYRTALRIGAGVLAGLLLAMPILIAFWDYLQNSTVGMHQHGFFAQQHIDPTVTINLLLPYLFGLIANSHNLTVEFQLWACTGGYFGIGMTALALLGLFGRGNRALRIALAALVVACLWAAYGGPFGKLIFLIPGLSNADFARYYNAAAAMALAVLAGFALDDLNRGQSPRRRYWTAILATILLLALAVLAARPVLNQATMSSIWFRNSIVIADLIFAVLIWIGFSKWQIQKRALVLGLLVAIEAMVNFAIPTFSNPHDTTMALGGIRFLQTHLGLQRFYSMGVIEPNYGSYFGIAQIDDCDLPIPIKWLNFRNAHLDPDADQLMFDGAARTATPARPTAVSALDQNLPQYLAVGVKYIVTRPNADPFTDISPANPPGTKVYSDRIMDIYQLNNPRPYFDAPGCQLIANSRETATLNCPSPATLTRLELFMPGWHATVNGKSQPLSETGEIFQKLDLPAGRSIVAFHFRPPFMRIAYLAFFIGLLLFAAIDLRRKPA